MHLYFILFVNVINIKLITEYSFILGSPLYLILGGFMQTV
jgi:hypothetical protein